jgi:hypothetical protein
MKSLIGLLALGVMLAAGWVYRASERVILWASGESEET